MSSGKKQQKKRKRQSSPPFKSQIARRLEKLRGKKRDLWADDDDDDTEQHKKSKKLITLTDSDEERPTSTLQRRIRSGKSKKKISQNHNENATCLICSILSQLSSYNCCSQHLSVLKNPQPTTTGQWLPDKVMIVPLTDDIVQKYLDPEQIHHLRKKTKKSSERNVLTPKSLNKSRTTSDISETQQSPKISSETDVPPLASVIVVESARPNSATIPPPDVTTIETSSSISIINNIETTTIIDDHQQENTSIKPIDNNNQTNPWIPISDEIEAALEQAIDSTCDTPLEYSPASARRTETEIMAARLPKLSLKEGRFRKGKPIINRASTDAASEYRPLGASQSPPSTSTIITTNVRSPLATTNTEKESSSEMPNTTDNQNDISTSGIFTQDETILTDKAPLSVFNENSTEINSSNRASCVTSSTTNARTPSRMSFRMNPDGSRVSISRPPLPTNHQSPLRRTSTDVTPIQPNTKQV